MLTVRPDSQESRPVSVAEVAAVVTALLDGVPEGAELDSRTAALTELAVVAAPTTLHLAQTSVALRRALLMHVREAIAQGAGRRAIRQVLDTAAAAPDHPGVR